MFKLIFYVPHRNAEAVKQAVFSTGAGQIGYYGHCSWETEGTGQFRPLAGANPTLGTQDKLEKVRELRVEVLCEEENIRQAIMAMKEAHPYEEPAYEVYEVMNSKFLV